MRNNLFNTLESFNLSIDNVLLNETIDKFNLGKESCFFIFDLLSDKCFYFCPSIVNILGHGHRKYLNKGFLYFKTIIHPVDFMYFIDELLTLVKLAENSVETVFYGDQSGMAIRIRHKEGYWLKSRIHIIFLKKTTSTTVKLLLGFIEKEAEANQKSLLPSASITEREKEVFKFISLGNSAKMIADKLSISENTVITHRKNLIHKLQVRNSAELITKGIELNILNSVQI
jgi:DNA-binding CsgD family transcriptional regulator